MDLSFWEHTKEAILNLCPVIGTVNWQRRASDTDGPNPYVQLLIRTAVSLIVAAIIGVGSGILSSYIMIQTMQVRLDNVNNKVDKLEDRFNSYTDRHQQ